MDSVLFVGHVPLGLAERPRHPKFFAQMEALKRLGYAVDFIGNDGEAYYLCDHLGGRLKLCAGRNTGPAARLRFFKAVKAAAAQGRGWSVAYVRAEPLVPQFLGALARLRGAGMRVVLELPTYPFFGERLAHGPLQAALGLLERLISRRLKAHVELIAAFCDEQKIFGIPVVPIENGIDAGAVRPRKAGFGGELNLLGLANFSDCHGYDRLITGMRDYYAHGGQAGVTLHLAGRSGSALRRWRSLAEGCGLGTRVVYHGEVFGGALDALIDKCDIGAAALGMYRKGLDDGSNLKVREYCARGLPFIYAYRERALGDGEPFAMRFENSPGPIDIGALLGFFERLHAQPQIGETMRAFAQAHYGWEEQFLKIFAWLEKNPKPAAFDRRRFITRLLRASVFKSAWYSLRLGLPVLVGRGSKIRLGRGAKVTREGLASLDVGVYWGYPGGAFLQIMEGGALRLAGPVHLCERSRVIVGRGAVLEVGAHTFISADSVVCCMERISIGAGCALSWNVTVLDSDGHKIAPAGGARGGGVSIGEHVLIGCGSTILKGVTVGQGAVIAAGAVVTRGIPPRCMAAGNPARVIRTGVSWDEAAIPRGMPAAAGPAARGDGGEGA